MVYKKHPVRYFAYWYLIILMLFIEEIILFIITLRDYLGTFVKTASCS